ncbi:MAG: sodium/proline symporter [Candidatus Zixiibacteriota bacterium]|nr:MAG: sodium/proline symporter [candidate division Zixibacteria bacterium]
MSAILVGFIVYLIVLLTVGFLTFRFNKTIADYVLAGRRLGIWVVTFSERASGESAWLLLGLPGVVFASGLSELWVAIGCTSGILFSWMFISRKLRTETEANYALTIPEFFENKYNDTTKSIRIFGTIIIVFFFTFYVCAQFIGAGKVLNVTFGIPQMWGMIIGALIILFYTIMGGFMAVAWTDLVQSLLMVFTLVLLPIIGLIEFGGWEKITAYIASTKIDHLSVLGGQTGIWAALSVISGLAWGLGYMGQPHLLARFMAVNKPDQLRKGAVIGISWAVLAFWGAMFIGLFGIAIFASGEIADPEKVMPRMATELLPGWLAGILISGAIAAMMSTADSQLLVATSAVAEDIYHNFVDKAAPEKKLVAVSRVATFCVGVAAFIIAIFSQELVFTMVGFAWSGLGSAFGPALFLTLWWRKTTREGVLAGMVVGTITVIIWHFTTQLKGLVYELAPGFVMAFLAVWLVSLATCKERRPAFFDK